jgi:hypothetical protein
VSRAVPPYRQLALNILERDGYTQVYLWRDTYTEGRRSRLPLAVWTLDSLEPDATPADILRALATLYDGQD